VTRERLASQLDAATPVVVALAILAAAAGAAVQHDLDVNGDPARWVFLALLSVFGIVRALVAGPEWRLPRNAGWVLAFVVLSFVSMGWTVNAHATLSRAVGQAGVVAGIGALAGCVVSRPSLADKLLGGVVGAAVVVALAGLAYWLVHPSLGAVQTTVDVWRYRGIEQSANTAPLLIAIALPITLGALLRAKTRGRHAIAAVALAGFVLTITASGSRNAVLGSLVGALVTVGLVARSRRRTAGLAAAVLAVFVLSVSAMTLARTASGPPEPAPPSRIADAETVLPLSAEIGNPWWTNAPGYHRSVFTGDVRLAAWHGAAEQAVDRPLAGYGFGAERWAFVNRYYAFNSQNPENGYVGLFLQLGLVGLLLFVGLLAVCIAAGVRAARAGVAAAPAAAGGAAACAALGVGQSFFHGPGSIAYVAFWICLLVAAALARTRAL
jgi:O-antigen ligase